jgi:ELWxxDGT repeat protein
MKRTHSIQSLFLGMTLVCTLGVRAQQLTTLAAGSSQKLVKVNDGLALFLNTDPTHGSELWRTDGTVSGTMIVKDINPGSQGTNFEGRLYAYNGKVMFAANPLTGIADLWMSDGTESGTIKITSNSIGSTPPWGFVGANGFWYFHVGSDRMWKTDGTPSGTVELPWAVSIGTSYQDKLFVRGSIDEQKGDELLMIAGLSGDEISSFDIVPGPIGSYPNGLIASNEYLFFGSIVVPPLFYRFDGTEFVTELMQGSFSPPPPIPQYLAGDKIFFRTSLATWASQVSPSTSVQVVGSPLVDNNSYSGALDHSGSLLFLIQQQDPTSLNWSSSIVLSDGTIEGTSVVKSFDFLQGRLVFCRHNNVSYFGTTGSIASAFSGVWKTGGTDATTFRILPAFRANEIISLGSGMLLSGAHNNTSGIFLFVPSTGSDQSITFGQLTPRIFGDPSFDLSATASSGLTVTYTSSDNNVAAVVGNTVTIVGVGTTVITALQAGDATYAPASPEERIFTVSKASQTITFPEIPTKQIGDPDFAPGATTSSGRDATYTSSNTSVAMINSNKIHIVGVGTSTITAYLSSNAKYNAATPVVQTLTVLANSKQDQTITFNEIDTKSFGESPFELTATASSGLGISYSSANTAVATISGNIVTIVGVGSSILTASQPGNDAFNAAPNVTRILTVTSSVKENQTITFEAIEEKGVGDAPFILSATASSGLAVSFSSGNTAVATISGNTVTIVGEGTADITASQPGNDDFNPAPNVTRTFTVIANTKENQTITFETIEPRFLGDDPFALNAIASSGFTVSYSSGNTAVATISGNTVTIVGAGSSVITASQTGNDDFNAAPTVTQTLTVQVPGNQTIPHFDYHNIILGGTSLTLAASLQTKNASTGEVAVNGVDNQAPQEGFTFIWGDGSSGNGFFPGTHTYSDKSRNYVISVVANYPNNKKDTVKILVDFVPLSIDPIGLDPMTRVFIPGSPFSFDGTRLYQPPSLTEFSDNAFTSFTRSQTEYILSIASSIGYDFVNHDAFLHNGKFEQFMLRDPVFAGAYSIWYTNPVGFGVNDSFLSGGDIDFSSLTHEMGHNYTLNVPANFYYGGRIDGNGNAIFSESMANMFAHAVGYQLLNSAEGYGLGEDVHFRLQTKFINSAKVIRMAYDRYLANNKPFASWNDPDTGPDETFDTFMTIAFKFMEHAETENQGYREPFKRMIALLQQFNTDLAAQYDQQHNTAAADAFRATLMVAALSNAFDTDLRQEFIDLNFPINDDVFTTLINGAEKDQQVITFNTLPAKMLGDEPFELQATASSGLTVSFTSSNTNVATISGSILTIVGVGSSVITAEQSGNSGYEAAAAVQRTLEVIANNRAAQTITFAAPATKTFGDAPFLLIASSTSANPIIYSSSNVAVATISGGEATIVGAGTTTITASQAANADFNAASPVSQVLTVNKASQTIIFPAIATKVFGDVPFVFDVSSTSELPLMYASSDPLVATIEGSGQVTIRGAGTTTITVSQAGDDNHNAATDATRTLTVSKASQSVIFTALTSKALGAAFPLEATATSDLTVVFSTQSDKVTINGTQATAVKAGRLAILADQAGNDNYLAAEQAEQSICINPAKPAIDVNDDNPESPVLSSSSASGNQWFLDGAPIEGAVNQTLTITDIGSYTVKVQVDDCISETSAANIFVVTGLDRAHDDMMSAYPNPAKKELVVRWGGAYDRQVIMFDLVGKELDAQSMSTGEIVFNIENLPKGTYLLKGVGSQTTRYFKFVKE